MTQILPLKITQQINTTHDTTRTHQENTNHIYQNNEKIIQARENPKYNHKWGTDAENTEKCTPGKTENIYLRTPQHVA